MLAVRLPLFALAAALAAAPAVAFAQKADEKPAGVLDHYVKRVVARVGGHDVTIGEMVDAAASFYPEARQELDSEYGRYFFESGAFDDWVDAYTDLLCLTRDPRIAGTVSPERAIPAKDAVAQAVLERAAMFETRTDHPSSAPARHGDPPATQPADKPVLTATAGALQQTRRLFGFECARQARLDELVAVAADRNDVRLFMIAHPLQVVGRLRLHHLLIPTRDAAGKRLSLERRKQIERDAGAVAARLRNGDPFETVVQQVRGKVELRPKDTLPWVSFSSPLPGPLLDALFNHEEGAEEIVGPIETRDGFYIGHVLERQKIAPPDFDRAYEKLARDQRRIAQLDLLRQCRKDAVVVIF